MVEDALSLTERLVLRAITAPENRLKNDTGQRGEICDPGGYTRLAKQIGVCRKTIYNAVKGLEGKNALREFRLIMKGKQRERTVYYAPHWGDLLPMWRADPELFKTAATPARLIARGRRKALVTIAEAAEVKMDAQRAPLRGSGRGRSEFSQAMAIRKAAAAPAPDPLPSDDDLRIIREQFLKLCPSNLKDAVDLLRTARAEAAGIPAAIVAQLMAKLGHTYKPSADFPTPRPKWFIDRIGSEAAYNAQSPPAKFEARLRGKVLGVYDTSQEAEAAIKAAQREKTA